MHSPEVAAKLAILRAKCAEGTLTLEDQREAIVLMRGKRKNAVPDTKRALRAKASIPKADDLLDELSKM